MLVLLLVIFVIAPLVELYVGSLVVAQVGWSTALLVVLVAAALGIWVIRLALRRRPRSVDTALLVLAGTLLVLPGYVTDIIGLLLLLPPVRALLKVWLGLQLERRLAAWNFTVIGGTPGGTATGTMSPGQMTGPPAGGPIVEGEVIDPDDQSKR